MAKTARTIGLMHEELSYQIIGCAQKVHGVLGPGFPESVYQRALSREFAYSQIPFQAQQSFEVSYEGLSCGQFRVDFFVDERIIVELKAVDNFCKQHEAQVLAYLKATNCHIGLLFNFGDISLKQKRLIL
jgi:GxxExxY protein